MVKKSEKLACAYLLLIGAKFTDSFEMRNLLFTAQELIDKANETFGENIKSNIFQSITIGRVDSHDEKIFIRGSEDSLNDYYRLACPNEGASYNLKQLIEKLMPEVYVAVPKVFQSSPEATTPNRQAINFIEGYFSFIQENRLEKQEELPSLGSKEAVWIASATLTYNEYLRTSSSDLGQYLFAQNSIARLATVFNSANVMTTCSQVTGQSVTAGRNNQNYSYLLPHGDKRRVSATSEAQKARPEQLPLDFKVNTIDGQKTVLKLIDFIDNQYTPFVENSDWAEVSNITAESQAQHEALVKNIKFIIAAYKENFEQVNTQERYKWEAQQWYKQHWSIDAPDFAGMLKNAFYKTGNLLNSGPNSLAYTQICQFAKDDPEGIRNAFSVLYDETKPLAERIAHFQKVFQDRLQVIAQQNPEYTKKLSSYQDLHAISVYLAFEYPEKYFIYKASCYMKFVKRVGYEETSATQNRSIRKLENLDQLCRIIINAASDQPDLMALHKNRLDASCYQDEALHFLAQDIMFYGSVYMPDELFDSDEQSTLEGDEETVSQQTTIGLNTILYGPPGTGKTYHTVIYAVAIIENKKYETIKAESSTSYKDVLNRYNEYRAQGRIEFTTFHQSYGYEEFIEGIKPVISEGSGNLIQYRVEAGVFKRFCELASNEGNTFDDAWAALVAAAKKEGNKYTFTRRTGSELIAKLRDDDAFVVQWKGETQTQNVLRKAKALEQWKRSDYSYRNTLTGGTKWEFDAIQAIIDTLSQKFSLKKAANTVPENQNYVFIIDEINRGNISKILGELITLIEESKRVGKEEGMKTLLPYSMKPFGVPENVYIIGTMNTADRSIATIDTALRRRFEFKEMLPEPDVVDRISVGDLSIAKMLKKMNQRIAVLYDREHTIGHAYFMPLKDDNSIKKLAEIFKNKVIPLLQEYFYEDYEKIRLVLGDNQKKDEQVQFIQRTPIKHNELFGSADVGIDEGYTYEINKSAFTNPEAYRLI